VLSLEVFNFKYVDRNLGDRSQCIDTYVVSSVYSRHLWGGSSPPPKKKFFFPNSPQKLQDPESLPDESGIVKETKLTVTCHGISDNASNGTGMNAQLDDWKRGDERLLYSALHLDPRLPPQRICTQLVKHKRCCSGCCSPVILTGQDSRRRQCCCRNLILIREASWHLHIDVALIHQLRLGL